MTRALTALHACNELLLAAQGSMPDSFEADALEDVRLLILEAIEDLPMATAEVASRTAA